MKRNGNVNSNRIYNPQNTKPAIPLDVDEVDAALERFIRQKYDQQIFSGGSARAAQRQDSDSTRSSDDQPPPLPPKPGKRFGFGLRSRSSAFTSSKLDSNSPPRSPDDPNGYRFPSSPIRVNKQSRVFGVSVGGGGEDLESKLATLRDMGFPDEKRNMNVLKGLSGNLEQAIESLVRLGEGSAPTSGARTPMQGRNIAVSQPLLFNREQSGLAFGISAAANEPAPLPQASYGGPPKTQNFAQPQDRDTGNVPFLNPFQTQLYNALETSQPQSATYNVERAFEGMQISQPLFPNATGGYPSQPQPLSEPRLQQSMTPPVPQVPHQYFQSNPYAQHTQIQTAHYNPFFTAPQVSSLPSSPFPNASQQQSFGTLYNPYATTQISNQAGTLQQSINGHSSPFPDNYSQLQKPEHHQSQIQMQTHSHIVYAQPTTQPQNFLQSNPYAIQQPSLNQHNPQNLQPTPHLPPQISQHMDYTPPPLQPQQTGRINKSSILALYNYPHLAPSSQATAYQYDNSANQTSSALTTKIDPLPTLSEGVTPKPAQRSVTMPLQLSSGSRNPFNQNSSSTASAALPAPINVAGGGARTMNGNGVGRNASHEGVDIGGFQLGRHSPDAFASLSARSVR